MTIDELCEVIRQRRKRTGFKWTLVADDYLREVSVFECCPITAGCLEQHYIEYNTFYYYEAGEELGMARIDIFAVVNAADGNKHNDPEVRAKLIAACCGPLE